MPILIGIMLLDGNSPCLACPKPPFRDQLLRAVFLMSPLAFIGFAVGAWQSSRSTPQVSKAFGVHFLGDNHELTKRVKRLADRLELPYPAVAIMGATNAFAVGDAGCECAVIIGQPLLTHLAPDELDAVIGHELGHIAAGDANRMNIALGYQSFLDWLLIAAGNLFSLSALVAGKIASRAMGDVRTGSYVSRAMVLLVQYTINFCATLATRALSRRREYYADAIGAVLTSSEAMQRALVKIHGLAGETTGAEKDFRMLMFRGGAGGVLFATHPFLENRLFALRERTIIRKIERLGRRRPIQQSQDAPQKLGYRAPVYQS